MKKLITLLLLFTITLFYSIPTQAYTLDGNDIPLVQTKNLFDKDTVIPNTFINHLTGTQTALAGFNSSDFIPVLPNTQYTTSNMNSNGAMYDASFNWDGVSGAIYSGTFTTRATTAYIRLSVSDANLTTAQLERGSAATSYANYGFLTLNEIFVDNDLSNIPAFTTGTDFDYLYTTNGTTPSYFVFNQSIGSNFFYFVNEGKVVGGNQTGYDLRIGAYNSAGSVIVFSFTSLQPTTINPATYTTKTIMPSTAVSLGMRGVGSAPNNTYDFNLKVINLTTIGLTHLLEQELDYYYHLWKENNSFIQGFNDGFTDGYTDGFNDGYDDGFDDGVASDTSFAVGYALGLSQGADMETGSSLLILIVALIGFILMIIGFITKRGIFNLLSTGAFIVLGGLLVEFVGFIIIAIGLVLINIYYAFFGNI